MQVVCEVAGLSWRRCSWPHQARQGPSAGLWPEAVRGGALREADGAVRDGAGEGRGEEREGGGGQGGGFALL